MESMFFSGNFQSMMRRLNLKSVSRFVLLLVAVLASTPAHGAVYSFLFQNVDGGVSGTVSGTITLSGDGDGTFSATSITINSAPVSLGYTTPYEVLTGMPSVIVNSFVVSGGQIDKASSSYGSQNSTEAFTLNLSSLGSLLSITGSASATTGVLDYSNSTLIYSSPTSAVPEPTSVAIFTIGALGMVYRARRKSNS